MQIEGASKIIESIDQTIGKDGLDNKKLIPKLKELRELARAEEDPLVVKTLRLIYEYLEENNAFDIVPALIVDEEEDEEEPEEPMDLTDTENLQYQDKEKLAGRKRIAGAIFEWSGSAVT